MTEQNLKLLPFQAAGVSFIGRRRNTLLADEMGLGKTVQALRALQADRLACNALIVCPASLKINWQREAEKWLEFDIDVRILKGKPKELQMRPGVFNLVIINYDILAKWVDVLKEHTFDWLIFDEAHYMKSPAAGRTKAAFELKGRRRLLITGTPLLNRPIELWPLVTMVAPGEFGGEHEYAKRYCNLRRVARYTPRGKKMVWDKSGSSNLDELKERLKKFTVRRSKSRVLKELPPKRRQIVPLDAPNVPGEAYLSSLGRLEDMPQVEFDKMAEIRKKHAVAKLPACLAYIRDVLETEESIIVFAHHREVIDGLKGALDKYGVVGIDGSTPSVKRQAAVDDFQSGKARVFVGNIMAAGVGITLTRASHVIFVELSWSPGEVTQAEDRAHRHGQTKHVLVSHLVADGTMDVRIARALIRKQSIFQKILDYE